MPAGHPLSRTIEESLLKVEGRAKMRETQKVVRGMVRREGAVKRFMGDLKSGFALNEIAKGMSKKNKTANIGIKEANELNFSSEELEIEVRDHNSLTRFQDQRPNLLKPPIHQRNKSASRSLAKQHVIKEL